MQDFNYTLFPTDLNELFTNRTFIVKDYRQVLHDIKHLLVPKNHKLYTVEHVNMYTNIELNMAISIISRDFDKS